MHIALPPGPIFWVELLTSSRRARYFVVRVLYATALLLALFANRPNHWGDVTDTHTIANFMAEFFSAFATMQVLAVVLLGPAMAAGTIATERERRTIEYLFAAPLGNIEIVLGKLLARLLQVACLVLVGVPVLALAMLLGGIAPEAIVVLLVITLSTVVTVAVLSIAVSVWSARAREAVVRAYLLLLVLLVVPPLLSWATPIVEPLLAANPFYVLHGALFQASSTAAADAWETVWALVRNQLIASVVALAAATFAVRRVHLKQAGTAGRRRRWRWQLFRPRIGMHPMVWKEVYAEPAAARLGMLGYLCMLIILLAVIGVTWYTFMQAWVQMHQRSSMGWFSPESQYLSYAAFMSTLLSCGGLLLLAARAAGSITSEKERQCWDSILGTPLDGRSIITAKMLGNLWAGRGLLLLLAIVWVPGVLLTPLAVPAVLVSLGTLAIVAVFVSALGVTISLRSRTSLRAMGGTLGILLFIGGGYLFCCIFTVFSSGPGPSSELEIILAPCIPFLLAMPGMIAAHGIPSHEAGIVIAYVLGNIGYLVAAMILYSIAVEGFDRLTGRTGPREQTPSGLPDGGLD